MFDLGAIKKAHARFSKSNEQMIDVVASVAGKKGLEHVRTQNRYTHRTGALRASTRARVIKLKSGRRLVLRSTARHAGFIEHGTRPHIIRARGRRPLSFFWHKVGRRVAFMKVNHPGTPAYHFLSAARDHSHRWAGSTLQRRMRQLAERF